MNSTSATNMKAKRLLIADDHELLLTGLQHLLAAQFEIAGVVTDGRALVAEAKRLQPDVIVADIGMPEMNGIDATRQIHAVSPASIVIILTQQLSSHHVQAAFRAGARGYVAKQSASTELLKAIAVTLSGKFYVTPFAVGKDGTHFSGAPLKENPADRFGGGLTGRQGEVLQLIAEGNSGKEISAALKISTKTVEFHKEALMNELGLRTTAELTRYALAHGIVKD